MFNVCIRMRHAYSLFSKAPFVLLIILFGFQLTYAQDNIYTLVHQGDLDRYFFPLWALDSKMFSVQVMSGEEARGKTNLLTLYIYYKSDDDGWKGIKLFNPEQKKKSGPVINKSFDRNERSLCWPVNNSAGKNKHWAMVSGGEVTGNSNNNNITIIQNWITELGEVKNTRQSIITGLNGLVHSYSVPGKAELFVTFNSQDRRVLNKIIPIGSNTPCTEVESFHLPIRSLAASEDGQVIILIIGSETVYEFWMSSDGGNSFSQLDILIDGYTIFTEVDIDPKDPNIISFIASDNAQSEKETADLCVYNMKNGKIINKTEVFRHKQIFYSGQAYHQWSPSGQFLYFIKSNSKNDKHLYMWNIESGDISKCNLPDNDIKTFKYSPDGNYLTIISNTSTRNMRIYSISR